MELNDKYMVKRLTMYEGKRCSLQYHEHKVETIYILEGILKITLDDKEKLYFKNDIITIYPSEKHRMEAIVDSVYLEASTPEIDDVVRIEDDYSRV